MFKHIDFPTNKHQIRQAWNRLIRVIQTELEHKRVTNTSGSDVVKGDIMYVEDSGRLMDLAINTSQAAADWCGVMSEPTADTETGIMRTEGYALVHFTAASVLANQEGSLVYVSATAGQGTIDPPNNPNWTSAIGILGDATNFNGTTNPYAYVFLGHCCGVGPVIPQ